ncbi:MAG: GNAT family N-acetyltransferase [Alphaproteobacteria bacterium]|nr:GNAT family N-acetyltransferase [Alphaproteobacteria bacterium]
MALTAQNTVINAVSVRLAHTSEEIEAAQRLRYKVFYEEYSAVPSPEMAQTKRDMDDYDQHADHLIVVDESLTDSEESVVGTYRLLRREAAERCGGFYSNGEYDLSPLLSSGLSLLELGRSCVLPEYRTQPILQLLWQGIAGYISDYGIDLMFGCASFQSTDIQAVAKPLSYLHHYHLAPEEIRPRALKGRYINMNIIPKDEITPKEVFSDLPPLIKGYLRVGASIGEGAVIDTQFGTTDVFIIVHTKMVQERYRKHYERKTQKPFPSLGGPEDAPPFTDRTGERS